MYHKPTHTYQYLQWDSHHNLSAKYSVIGTFTHRAKVVCTSLELLNEELQHLKVVQGKCKYPRLAINKGQNKLINGNWERSANNNNHAGTTTQETSISSDNNQQTDTQGKTKCGTHGHPINSGPEGEHQTYMQQIWYTDPFQRKQNSQTTSGSTQEQ